ncbi:hypothetical protein [Phenylobacterium sp.]|uniref:hypothetical protein n=1 Tax=Phenylobacterium sp. TaxID=1871053 RepID=UPI002DE4DCF9|nr:hypothetical protein [Phenylobacterium sp.]
MRSAIFSLAAGLAVLAASPVSAASINVVRVMPSGETLVAVTVGRARVVATLATHTVEIGRASDPPPERPRTNCTYSRIPCVITDVLELRVDGAVVEVPRSVFGSLTDIGGAQLRPHGKGHYELVLRGGDAAAAYEARVLFDRRRVLERTIIDSEAGVAAEHTTYFDVSKAFID